jgi:hypothetical protein
MTGTQREAAFGLMQASLSARGMRLTHDIMRLNETLAELTGDHDFWSGPHWERCSEQHWKPLRELGRVIR